MNLQRATMLIDAAYHATYNLTGEYSPRIRTIYSDFSARDHEDNIVVFHQREMVTIASLISLGVDPRVAAFLIEKIEDYKRLQALEYDHATMPIYPVKLAELRAQLIAVAGFLWAGGGL